MMIYNAFHNTQLIVKNIFEIDDTQHNGQWKSKEGLHFSWSKTHHPKILLISTNAYGSTFIIKSLHQLMKQGIKKDSLPSDQSTPTLNFNNQHKYMHINIFLLKNTN
jgi:hypothetical protein